MTSVFSWGSVTRDSRGGTSAALNACLDSRGTCNRKGEEGRQRVGMMDSWAKADKQERLLVLYVETTCSI